MPTTRFPRLHPAQVCFVVDDVAAAVSECVERFGWGPFHAFDAPVEDARYGDWTGFKHTDVALGMAGGVQVELIHVRAGRDTVGLYQARYGAGFQHLGISCRDRDAAIEALVAIGGRVDDRNEYPGIRFAFIDTPTGPGMFELLEPTGDGPPGSDAGDTAAAAPPLRVAIDRATVVTRDLDAALAFYASAFRWDDAEAESCSLRIDGVESRVRRVRGRAGQLDLELIEPAAGSTDLYARHLERGEHGLVHAGGTATTDSTSDDAVAVGEWLEDGETFSLHDWAGGPSSLQLRSANA